MNILDKCVKYVLIVLGIYLSVCVFTYCVYKVITNKSVQGHNSPRQSHFYWSFFLLSYDWNLIQRSSYSPVLKADLHIGTPFPNDSSSPVKGILAWDITINSDILHKSGNVWALFPHHSNKTLWPSFISISCGDK